MFLSAVWTLTLMAPIHCRGSIDVQVMLNIFDGLRVNFEHFSIFGVNYSFNIPGQNCLPPLTFYFMSESKHGVPLLINLLLCSDTWFLSLPRVITNHGQEKLNSDVFIYQSDVERVLLSLREPTALNSRLKDSVLFQDAINTLDLPQCYFDIYIFFHY